MDRKVTAQFYPATDQRLPKWRLYVLAVAFILGLSWVGYSMVCDSPRWENYLVLFTFIFAITANSIAESFWPVISVQENQLVIHRALWAGKRFQPQDIARINGDGKILYLTTKSEKQIAVSLQKLTESDRTLAREAIEKFLDRHQVEHFEL